VKSAGVLWARVATALTRTKNTTKELAVNRGLIFRILVIGFLMIVLLIPIGLIHGVVANRAQLQWQVEQTIADTSAGPQRIAGPILVVPYIERELLITKDDKGREKRSWSEHARHAVFIPVRSDIAANVKVEKKHKGLYKALVFQTASQMKASFEIPINLGLSVDPSRIVMGKPYIAIGLSDVRGISTSPEISLDGRALTVASGTNWQRLGDGIRAETGRFDSQNLQRFELAIKLNFAGTRSLSVAPIGKTTAVTIDSPWPHPNFGGRFSPKSPTIGASGFSAQWEISQLASRNGDLIDTEAKPESALEAFDVSFIEPVNVYLQAERAVKYGIVFVALTFAAFFVFESLKNLRIHPLQYGLVGLALALFFLLLVSLSEHIKFVYAYLTASAACVSLIAYYLRYVLGGWGRGFWFGAKLAILYAVLYGLLLSEDNALMLGSLLLFVALAAIMFVTRHVNWYQLGSAGSGTTAVGDAAPTRSAAAR
jgi:inner membrane protein